MEGWIDQFRESRKSQESVARDTLARSGRRPRRTGAIRLACGRRPGLPPASGGPAHGALSSSGDPRRRHRQRGHARGDARAGGRRPALRYRLRLAALRLELRDLRHDRADDAGGRHRTAAPLRRDPAGRRGLSRRAGPRLALGPPDPAAPGLPAIRQPAPDQAAAGRFHAARGPQPGRHRLRHRAREQRGRVLRDGRAHLCRHRAGGGGAGERLHPPGRRPGDGLRLRARAQAAGPCRLRHQVQRHHPHHALLGRALRGVCRALPRRRDRELPHRHPERPFRRPPGLVRRGGGQQPLRRHPLGPRRRVGRRHGARARRQPQPRRRAPLDVRAGAPGRRRTSPAAPSPTRWR